MVVCILSPSGNISENCSEEYIASIKTKERRGRSFERDWIYVKVHLHWNSEISV